MSVDTHLKGKDTSRYQRIAADGVEVLIAPSMARWSRDVRVGTKAGLFSRSLDVEVEHEHTAACQH